MRSKKVIVNVIAAVAFLIIAILIVYGFSQHYIVINTCSGGRTLIIMPSGPVCFPNIYNTIIVNGTPYTLNSSLAAYDGRVIPLDFKFVGDNPLLTIWNSNTSSVSEYFLTIPDTFKLHMQYTSDVPTEFIVMTSTQYAQWVSSRGSVINYVYEVTGTSVSTWFNDSAGCAGYVAIIKAVSGSTFTISPNETALYDPAPQATGVCS